MPKMIEESVFGKVGAQNFDQAQPVQKWLPIRNRGHFCRSKLWDAHAAKNRFFNHFRYIQPSKIYNASVKPPPLLFLHGFLGSSADWVDVCSFLEGKTCVAINLPGHGGAPFTEYFEEELLLEKPVHLIGYSMGGRLALRLAARYPKRVASLTLLGAHFGLPEEERAARLRVDEEWARVLIEEGIDKFLLKWYDQPLFETTDRLKMRALRRGQNPTELARALLHYSLGRQPVYRPQGTLLVGEFDRKFREYYQKLNLPHYIIPNAGHPVHLEQPRIVAEHILKATS